MGRILSYFRAQKVLTISLIAALISSFLIPPDADYLQYIDYNVLMLLFSLMAVVGGMKQAGVFTVLSRALIQKAGDTRRLTVFMTLSCFFLSMIVTNDVALITFVPLTVALLSPTPAVMIYAVTLEAIAANLGSMLTPIGNPQNMYLFTHYHMQMPEFLSAVAPIAAVSLGLVLAGGLLTKRTPLTDPENHDQQPIISKGSVVLLFLQLVLCLMTVFKLVPHLLCFVLVLVTMLFSNRKALAQVDYALLGTFVCFFIFVGNLSRIDTIKNYLHSMVAGNELEAGILCSQIISNVPAALMLSGFTDAAVPLLRGVNLGGLGTLIGSLASLIAFRLYCKTEQASPGKFLGVFTLMNVVYLVPLYLVTKWLFSRI